MACAHGRLQGMIFNELRSKTKTLEQEVGLDPTAYPDWSFDGSSTGQAQGSNSDCILRCVVQPSVQQLHADSAQNLLGMGQVLAHVQARHVASNWCVDNCQIVWQNGVALYV